MQFELKSWPAPGTMICRPFGRPAKTRAPIAAGVAGSSEPPSISTGTRDRIGFKNERETGRTFQTEQAARCASYRDVPMNVPAASAAAARAVMNGIDSAHVTD